MVCDVPVISSVRDVAGDAAGALVSAPFEWLAQGMGHAAGWMFEAVWMVFDSTTMVDVTSSQYTKVYNILFGVAVFVTLGFFLLQVIGGMILESVRRPRAFGDRVGDHRPALHRHRQHRRHQQPSHATPLSGLSL